MILVAEGNYEFLMTAFRNGGEVTPMQKTLFSFFSFVLMLAVGGCGNMLDADLSKEGKGAVVTYGAYVEYAAYSPMFQSKKMMKMDMVARAYFKNRDTGKTYMVGNSDMLLKSSDPYAYSSLPPGHYNLHSFNIGTESYWEVKYDSASCGNIGFDVGPNDLVYIKGMRPAAAKSTMGIRHAELVEFSYTPKNLKETLARKYPDLAGRNFKIPSMKSDNPAAFAACVKRMGDGNKLLNGRAGSYMDADPEDPLKGLPFKNVPRELLMQ